MKVITPSGPGELLGYILTETGKEMGVVRLRVVNDVSFQRLHLFRDEDMSKAQPEPELTVRIGAV